MTEKKPGVIIGFRDLHFAPLLTDNKEGATYSTPIEIGKAISGTISPQIENATLYANDGVAETNSSLSVVEVELEIDKLTPEIISALFGYTKNEDGAIEYTNEINAPYGALLFKSPTSTGGEVYVQLTKGKFTIPEDSFATKGESIEYQTKTITGTFVAREFDNRWRYDIYETVTNKAIIDAWFTNVYLPTPVPTY